MNTKRITLIFSVLLFALSSFAKKNATTEIFPLQQLTGNTDAQLIAKYRDADTIAGFQKLEHPFRPDVDKKDAKTLKKRISNIQKKRSKYPKTKINNIDEAVKWMSSVYGIYVGPCYHSCSYLVLSYYKQVDDGFLIKGKVHVHTDNQRYCRRISWKMYLVDYDHNILQIKHWREDPCPNKPHINVEVHLPEIESTEVCYPELSDHNISNFFKYPVISLENNVQGKVLVSFIVETDGSVSNIEIVRGVDSALSREAIKGIKLTDGKWISGMENGEKIPLEIKIEIDFNLGDGYDGNGGY